MWPPFFGGPPYIWRTTVRHDVAVLCNNSIQTSHSAFQGATLPTFDSSLHVSLLMGWIHDLITVNGRSSGTLHQFAIVPSMAEVYDTCKEAHFARSNSTLIPAWKQVQKLLVTKPSCVHTTQSRLISDITTAGQTKKNRQLNLIGLKIWQYLLYLQCNAIGKCWTPSILFWAASCTGIVVFMWSDEFIRTFTPALNPPCSCNQFLCSCIQCLIKFTEGELFIYQQHVWTSEYLTRCVDSLGYCLFSKTDPFSLRWGWNMCCGQHGTKQAWTLHTTLTVAPNQNYDQSSYEWDFMDNCNSDGSLL